ncbi:hypothetical protein BE20_01115 [Sorangium cellulosum]|nr:hypothetical protein BE20_01115 [Sorangium cellulosum]
MLRRERLHERVALQRRAIATCVGPTSTRIPQSRRAERIGKSSTMYVPSVAEGGSMSAGGNASTGQRLPIGGVGLPSRL